MSPITQWKAILLINAADHPITLLITTLTPRFEPSSTTPEELTHTIDSGAVFVSAQEVEIDLCNAKAQQPETWNT
jgi:hypothetical protein